MTLKYLPSTRALSVALLGVVLVTQPATTALEEVKTVPVALRARLLSDWSPAERALMRMQNRARIARGIEPMGWRRSLSAIARAHSRLMRSRGTIFHSTSTKPFEGFRWSIAGENVGVGPSIDSLYAAFMNSPGHRANILHRRYDRVGVGIARDGDTIYVTALFMG